MAIFVDTGVWVAARNQRDDLHAEANQVLENVLEGGHGRCYTSDYVFGECIILAIVRTKQHSFARDLGEYITEFPRLTFLFTPESIFRDAWNLHDQYRDKSLSFTDCTIISWCNSLDIEFLASFDANFDGILQRVIK